MTGQLFKLNEIHIGQIFFLQVYSFCFKCSFFRHRAVNLFLQGYDKSWIETEEHYFEDKLIEDLAVRLGERVIGMYCVLTFSLYSNNDKSLE